MYLNYTVISKIMRLTVLILLTALLHVSARSTAQHVTLRSKQLTLGQVFVEINKQTGYRYLWFAKNVSSQHPVEVSLDEAPLATALDRILDGLPLSYTIEDKVILIREAATHTTPPSRHPERSAAESNGSLLILAIPEVKGKIVDSLGNPLSGASVRVLDAEGKRTSLQTQTDRNGEFLLRNVPEGAILEISYVGYKRLTINAAANIGMIALDASSATLEEIEIVNTGYQSVPKERATGSFVQLDNKLLNRRVSPNLLERLEGVTSGLIFNSNYPIGDPNNSPISIRGLSTIYANKNPLVILDNFPYDGEISNINPNDVENITILRDAAAASIWGAKSGNGVIVITSKTGRRNTPLSINFNSNATLVQKPDLYYGPNFLQSSDYIDAEISLFEKGYYNSAINNTTTRPLISPVVEVLAQRLNGSITGEQANSIINSYRDLDFRDDQSKYLYRTIATQQYYVDLSGGAEKASYRLSAGYDYMPSVEIGAKSNRVSLNSHIDFNPITKLSFGVGINYVLSSSVNNSLGNINPGSGKDYYYPYAQLADDTGLPLSLPRNYRYAYISGLDEEYLLDWDFVPLEELRVFDSTSESQYARINTNARYHIAPWINIEARYQLERQNSESRNHQSLQSYYARNLINLYTQADAYGNISRPIPAGGILDKDNSNLTGQSIRGQVNVNREFNLNHRLSGILGIDAKQLIIHQSNNRLYGYDDLLGTSLAVDYVSNYQKYNGLAFQSSIPYLFQREKLTDIFMSYFSNVSYMYRDRYIVSGSARIDQSNLFGVETNQKSVPLWSAGLAWEISKEDFFNLNAVEYLRIRSTYGFNGNVDKSVSAYTTALFINNNYLTGLPYVYIQNPPNDQLSWERIGFFNIAADFQTKNNRLQGSIEYYSKNGNDLIGYTLLDPTVGTTQLRGNVANYRAQGIDIDLTLRVGNRVQWISNLLFSRSVDEITKYNYKTSVGAYLQVSDGGIIYSASPVVGQPIYSIASYPWAGLDPENGDPQGYFLGEVSSDYNNMSNSTNFEDLIYHGSAIPTTFGAFRNTFYYNSLSLSFNVTYKLGYYFRRPSIHYFSFASNYLPNVDYINRWQSSGDEQVTNVPSMAYPLNYARDEFYKYSEVLVEKGDHIRLQDIQVSYTFREKQHIKGLEVYAYMNNLGLLWKSTNASLDPDFVHSQYVNPKTFSIGVKAHF